MRILILEERRFPSSTRESIITNSQFDSVRLGLLELNKVYELKSEDFSIEYAVNDLLQDTDFDSVSLSKYKKSLDVDDINALIDNYEVVIMMGSLLCESMLGKKLNKIVGKTKKVRNTIVIPAYSSFYYSRNEKSCLPLLSAAYGRISGDIYDKPYTSFEVVKSVERLKCITAYAKETGFLCFDFETTGLEYYSSDKYATILSISVQPGYSYIVPFESQDFEWGIESESEFSDVLEELRIMFADDSTTKIAHNLKFDFHWLCRYDIAIKGRLADTMLMSHVLEEGRKHGLKSLTTTYFPFWDGYDSEVDFKKNTHDFDQLCQYAAMDTDITLRLFYIFEDQLLTPGNEMMYTLLRNLLIPSLIALQDMEYRGCKLDRELILESIAKAESLLESKLASMNSFPEVLGFIAETNKIKVKEAIQELYEKIERRKDKAKDIDTDRYIVKYREQIAELKTMTKPMYTEVNYNSHVQLGSLLYDSFGFGFDQPIVDGVKKKSSGREYIQEIDHPFIHTMMAYRSISKMLSTYYNGLLERLDVNDIVHGSFLLHGTRTGRLSSRNPNLQNIPSRLGFDDDDAKWALKQVKKFFVPIDEDYVVVQADYSQAELRVIANLSKDPTMIAAYKNGEDLHAKTGATIRGVSLEEFYKLPKDEFKKFRTHAKPANFGWVFKASIPGYIEFAKTQYGLILTEQEAKRHKDAIFNTYKLISKWHDTYEKRAKKYGYVETMFGRRRRFENINNSTNQGLINKDIRDAINSPVQGTSGEFTIFCIALLYHRLPSDCWMWCTVHDSIFFYIRKDKLHYLNIINETCENPPLKLYFGIKDEDFPVPMKMEYEISDQSWGHMEEVGDFQTIKEALNI